MRSEQRELALMLNKCTEDARFFCAAQALGAKQRKWVPPIDTRFGIAYIITRVGYYKDLIFDFFFLLDLICFIFSIS